MPAAVQKRLSPEVRRAEILAAAKKLLDRDGVRGFSLEAVAREAGVAASLPRHYFGSSVELLSAATADVLKDVERAVRAPVPNIPVSERLDRYLDIIRKCPWGHSVWMRAEEIHPSVEAIVRKGRIRMGEAILRRRWKIMSKQERLLARGYVGFIEAVVSDWIDRDFSDRRLVIETLLHGVKRFQPSAK